MYTVSQLSQTSHALFIRARIYLVHVHPDRPAVPFPFDYTTIDEEIYTLINFFLCILHFRGILQLK